MAVTERVIIQPHTGLSPVYDAGGNIITNVEHDTGLKRIYLLREEDGERLPGSRQIGFLHPNGYMHFLLDGPPEFFEKIKSDVEKQTGTKVKKVGIPPQVEEPEPEPLPE